MVDRLIEKSVGKVSELIIGASANEGGTRKKIVKIGGQDILSFHHFEGNMPNSPAVAAEVWDRPPKDEWPWFYERFKDIVTDLTTWVKTVEDAGADLICLRLASCHPDEGECKPENINETIKKILNTTSLPLIIIGSGHTERDSDVLLYASESAKNERCLIGMAVKENYKTISAAALSNGHSIIAESPLDINLAKQLNILISDMDLPLDRVIIHPTTGGLGYGFEYCYSIMERSRLAALQGDKIMSTPIINMIAQETWKVKETKTGIEEQPTWGELDNRGPAWEIAAAAAYIHGGADLLVLTHPESIKTIKLLITKLMTRNV